LFWDYVEHIHKAGREDSHRLTELKKLRGELRMPSDDVPCIAFLPQTGTQVLGFLRIPSKWYADRTAERAFSRDLVAWLSRPDVKRLATSDLGESEVAAQLRSLLVALTVVIDEAIAVPEAIVESPRRSEANTFQLDGTHWRISFCGHELPPLDALKGLQVIQFLIEHPGREYAALALAQGVLDKPTHDSRDGLDADGADARWNSEGMQVLDDTGEHLEVGTPAAHQQIRRRRAELLVEKEEIESMGGEVPIELLEEIEELESSAMADYDAKGRPRWQGGSRRTAQSRINQLLVFAREKVGAHSPELALHLKNSIQTAGAVYSYRPDRTIDWDL
jgi:hypothetical protein